VFGYLIGQAFLSLLPLLRLALKKGGLNKAIEPIIVKLIKAILNLAVLCSELTDRLVPEPLLGCVALM